MQMIKEVLRLLLFCGLSIRGISKSTGVARSTVAEYVARAKEAGIEWERIREFSEKEIQEKLFPIGIKVSRSGKKPVPDWLALHEELKKHKNLTLTLLWYEYIEENPDGYKHSQFHYHYSRWKKKLGVVMRQEHKAGEKLFVDFCDGPWILGEDGQWRKSKLFVAVWGASNYTFVRAVSGEDLPNWISAHVAAYEFFGCVPHIEVPDNTKSGVSRACLYEPDLNRTFADMAEHYNVAVIPARPAHPRDKPKVEAGCLLAQRWILAVLRNRIFTSITDLNAAIEPLLLKLNNKPLCVLKKSRLELFEALDRPAALSLPLVAYEYSEWKKQTLPLDYHVLVDVHYYSAPYQLVGEEVFARITTNIVEIFYSGGRVASHIRRSEPGKSTLPEHMPRSHREHAGLNLEVIQQWAIKVGPATSEVFDRILRQHRHSESAFHSFLGIYRLSKPYGNERIERAAKRMIAYGSCSYRSMKKILTANLDKQQTETKNGSQPMPSHENIRGSQYYQTNEANII